MSAQEQTASHDWCQTSEENKPKCLQLPYKNKTTQDQRAQVQRPQVQTSMSVASSSF